jgi:hypothetical protein
MSEESETGWTYQCRRCGTVIDVSEEYTYGIEWKDPDIGWDSDSICSGCMKELIQWLGDLRKQHVRSSKKHGTKKLPEGDEDDERQDKKDALTNAPNSDTLQAES